MLRFDPENFQCSEKIFDMQSIFNRANTEEQCRFAWVPARKRFCLKGLAMKAFTVALVLVGGWLYGSYQHALANPSASQEGLLIRSKQDGTDRVTFEAVNSSNLSVRFSYKVSYTYRTLTDSEHSESKTFDAILEPGQFKEEIGAVMAPKIHVNSVMILYLTKE
jgi:hypothetical protein